MYIFRHFYVEQVANYKNYVLYLKGQNMLKKKNLNVSPLFFEYSIESQIFKTTKITLNIHDFLVVFSML